MSVTIGQRYHFKNTGGSFIAEVEKITGESNRQDMRVVQIIAWRYEPIGHLYRYCNVADGCWTLLEGQDKPKN